MRNNKTRLTITLLASLLVLPATIFVSSFQNTEEVRASVGNYSTDPATYYNSVNGLSGNNLLFGLHNLMISTHKTYTSYDDNGSNGYQAYTDKDPNNSNNIIAWYCRASVSKVWNSGNLYNREHVWPQSLTNKLYGTSGAGADMHHIRPTIVKINSDRGNKLYGTVGSSYSTSTYGTGNLISKYTSSIFEPHDQVKGDAARIIMYMYVHFNSSKALGNGTAVESYTGTLPITNVIAGNTSAAWNLLLNWNQIDPVDVLETNRNNQVAIYQGNRNPFIDHPEYANSIWGTTTAPTSLSLTPSSASIGVGSTQNLTVTALPAGASSAVTWSSSNNSIATVANGVVTAKAEGQATITATSTSNSSITATMTITVTPISPTEEANTWASDFLSQTSLGCQNKNLAQLQSVWSSVSSRYTALSEAAKMLISSTTPNALGSDLENAVARYIDIVSKYDLQAFINGIPVPSQNLPSLIIPEDNMAFLLIFLNIFVIAGILIFVMIRKAKHL